MKKLTTLVLAAVAILALTGCGLDAPPEWDVPNPLDSPATLEFKRPPASGIFGPPHGPFEGF